MRSLMRENESERAESAASGGGWGGGLRECKQITSNSVSDWLEREMLRGEGGMRGSAVYASRGCPQDVFPSSFIYFSYLFIHLSTGSAIGRAGPGRPGLFLFISLRLLGDSLSVHCDWLWETLIQLS